MSKTDWIERVRYNEPTVLQLLDSRGSRIFTIRTEERGFIVYSCMDEMMRDSIRHPAYVTLLDDEWEDAYNTLERL